ncbi:hypothetical protein D7X98_03100 [bacterium 1XD8-76]|nr:hypothetical protein D7X98_03100 [bacterium 1XD8-76]
MRFQIIPLIFRALFLINKPTNILLTIYFIILHLFIHYMFLVFLLILTWKNFETAKVHYFVLAIFQ